MAKQTKATAALTLSSDAKVPEMLSLLDKQIADLKHIEESVYRTSGQLEGFGTNLKTELSIERLISAKASIMVREKYYNEAAIALGRKSFPQFTVGGFTTEDWDKDIALRINIIEHKETLDKLNHFKAQATKFLSEEDQKQMLFDEMANFFTKK